MPPCFEVIPVIDLKDGAAVAAVGKRGRAAYRPLNTPLCRTGDAVEAARGYLSIHPFSKIYIADLDAIERGYIHDSPLKRIKDALPGVELWVDNGLRDEDSCRAWMAKGLGRLVLGSESQRTFGLAPRVGAVLSLDFRNGAFLGPPEILEEAGLWPGEVIAMTLDDVGAWGGPNMELLTRLRQKAPAASVYAAGGVRDAADVAALASLGARGALVATALHNGTLTGRELAALQSR
jgi:phosphoribosylformimino-5-aminoimidazole carboxamide ribotide isomerase